MIGDGSISFADSLELQPEQFLHLKYISKTKIIFSVTSDLQLELSLVPLSSISSHVDSPSTSSPTPVPPSQSLLSPEHIRDLLHACILAAESNYMTRIKSLGSKSTSRKEEVTCPEGRAEGGSGVGRGSQAVMKELNSWAVQSSRILQQRDRYGPLDSTAGVGSDPGENPGGGKWAAGGSGASSSTGSSMMDEQRRRRERRRAMSCSLTMSIRDIIQSRLLYRQLYLALPSLRALGSLVGEQVEISVPSRSVLLNHSSPVLTLTFHLGNVNKLCVTATSMYSVWYESMSPCLAAAEQSYHVLGPRSRCHGVLGHREAVMDKYCGWVGIRRLQANEPGEGNHESVSVVIQIIRQFILWEAMSRFLRSLSGRLSAQGADLSDLDLLQISAVECRCSYRGTSLFILTGKDNQNINLRHPVLFQSPSSSQPLPQPQYVFSNCHSIIQKSLDDLVHK
eukprot:gene530-567_t